MTEERYGNTGRNQFYGPGFWNYNMSLFRTFPLQGRTRLQFRVEGFSLTNKPQWSNPNGSVTSGASCGSTARAVKPTTAGHATSGSG